MLPQNGKRLQVRKLENRVGINKPIFLALFNLHLQRIMLKIRMETAPQARQKITNQLRGRHLMTPFPKRKTTRSAPPTAFSAAPAPRLIGSSVTLILIIASCRCSPNSGLWLQTDVFHIQIINFSRTFCLVLLVTWDARQKLRASPRTRSSHSVQIKKVRPDVTRSVRPTTSPRMAVSAAKSSGSKYEVPDSKKTTQFCFRY